MKITIEQLKEMAEKAGLCVIEDFCIGIANDEWSVPISPVDCMTESPYETLYSKREVQKIIKLLNK